MLLWTTNNQTGSSDDRLWHLADVQTALMNVRFEGNNGHDADVTRCLLMTQSGHAPGLYGLEDGCPLVMTCFRRSGLTEISPVNGRL